MWNAPRHAALPSTALLALICSGCGSDSEEAKARPIDIGLITSISGDLAGLGREYTDATTLAFSEINAQGGVLGRPIRIVVEDDGTSTATAQVGYAALLDAAVPVVLGPTFSDAAFQLAPQIKAGQTLTIGQTTTSPALTTLDDGGFFFRVVASDLVQAGVLASLMIEERKTFPFDELCVVSRKDVYGTAFAKAIQDNLEKAGAVSTFDDASYDPNQSDLSHVLDACGDPKTKQGTAAIVFITFVADGAAIINDAIKRGWSPSDHRFFFTDGAQDPLLFTLLDDPSSLDGAKGVGPSGPDKTQPVGARLSEFEARFNAFYGRAPTFYAENAYDAAYVAAMCIEVAGSAKDRVAVRNGIEKVSAGNPGPAGDWKAIRSAIAKDGSVDYLGASGEVNFDLATGDILPPYWVQTWAIEKGTMVTTGVRAVDK